MHILKKFISMGDLKNRWGCDKGLIESFTYEDSSGTILLVAWDVTEIRNRPDGGQSAFAEPSSPSDSSVFDMADVLEIEKLNPELVQTAMDKNDKHKMRDGKFVFAEHKLIEKDNLYKRWPGATHEEIARHFDTGELRAYEHYKGPINGIIWSLLSG